MKLTEEQAQIVADNHNLIYWYINIANLNVQEWYDLLAIELCYTVIKHDPSKSSLATYFVLRADGLVCKEYRKSQSQKRFNNNVHLIDNVHYVVDENDMEALAELNELFQIENGELLRLKYEGYTQTEIAKELGVSQSYVSKILKKMRDESGFN